ncbi:MAG: stage III sporulation protein AF [Lachnospiraceae bacterium]|nr:stage III sporulation protein AF [Lachnospiraceae bacterium]
MQWICSIALFLVLSSILLEMIADTRYYKFARWVAGVILLLQFLKPFTDTERLWEKFKASFWSFDYALGADKVLEEIYRTEEVTESAVLLGYKENISRQIGQLLQENGLWLLAVELEVEDSGKLKSMDVTAQYLDGTERKEETIWVPTVVPVNVGETPKKHTVSPMELYIRETLAEFYQMDENKIEVVIQEAE